MGEGERPLSGLRVIDFGQYIAGPAVAMILADQGADVIRVEAPGGPFWDSPANAILNRGKRSIRLDLKDESEREVARRLVAGADVLVENFRPGVMARLSLGADAMTEANPRLVYLSLPGFSSRDQERVGLQAFEGFRRSPWPRPMPPPWLPPRWRWRCSTGSGVGGATSSRCPWRRPCSRAWLTTCSTWRTIRIATNPCASWRSSAAAAPAKPWI
jgi:hypothetical protein